jgi:hypothetical protein
VCRFNRQLKFAAVENGQALQLNRTSDRRHHPVAPADRHEAHILEPCFETVEIVHPQMGLCPK